MPESPKRLTTEEIWATALAVLGGVAVLVPLIVFAVGSQRVAPGGGISRQDLPVATENPSDVAKGTDPNVEETGGRARVSSQPIPSSASALRKELLEARSQIDALIDELEVAKGNADASERSAKRAWIQLRESAGETDKAPVEGRPAAGTNPG